MPVEAKPLFRPEVLRPRLATFFLSDPVKATRPKLHKWAEMLASGRADDFKEQEILPDFLTDIFCELLGYTRAVDHQDRYTISRERHVQVDGKYADAVLGEFRHGKERFIVAVEGKGPKDPLDRPFAGRKMSAVDQAYRYAINLPCDWVIVTSIRQTRLYFKGADQYTYERFDTEKLAEDEALLRKFVFLLGADRVVPFSGVCHFHELLTASEKVGRELTKEFYFRYAEIREQAFSHLCETNSGVPPESILSATQKLLDRILFCAFSEDRGLLPSETIANAYSHRDPYNPRLIWENFRGLFRAVDIGNPALSIPSYNGGLFASDNVLDRLVVPDQVCGYFRDLAAYDFRPASQVAGDIASQGGGKLIDVEILGHIFEQSISALEKIRFELQGLTERLGLAEHNARRKKEGAFYTPSFITRYILGEALGRVLKDRFERLRIANQQKAAKGTKTVLADPNAFDPATLTKAQASSLIQFWEEWQDTLKAVRILDPACGSGAFLIEAFEQMYAAFQASNDRLEELRGHRTLFDLDTHILRHNLYGVDLNEEAVEICRLSLWIKTAQRGKALTSLDHTIRVGNSVVADPKVHPRAFDWHAGFPEVFENGGFDVVVGNPPYVRQEWISPYKPYFQEAYRSYHGTADIYVYFYELGMGLLKPGGRLSFVVTNKWMKSGYGEPLRRFFAEKTWVESVVDFGHAKQIFPDADVFPSIIVARRPNEEIAPLTTKACVIPRDQLRISDLSSQIEREGVEVDRAKLNQSSWQLESRSLTELLSRILESGEPLTEFTEATPLSGVKTGFNPAFLIDSETRALLVKADPSCADIIKKYVRGQDIERWHCDWSGLWMITIKSSGDFRWPWSGKGNQAEAVFRSTYPSVHAHLMGFEEKLKLRQDQGEHWWELRSCAYWNKFDSPKIMYQEITWKLQWCFDKEGTLCNNTAYILPTSDFWILAVLNSPLCWWYSWRTAVHGKDEALRFIKDYVKDFPIAAPNEEQAVRAEAAVKRLIELSKSFTMTVHSLLDWLKVEHEIDEPSTKLRSPIEFDSDGFIAEIKKVRGKKRPLSLAALRLLREEFARTVVPAQALAQEARALEYAINDLVNEAYGLTPAEVALMWETAPPRMPIDRPNS